MNRFVLLGVGTLIFAVALASTSAAKAQQPEKAGPEHERLKDFEGTWNAVVKAGPQDLKGVAVNKMECGGLWMVSELNGEFGGAKFQGRGMDGFDVEKQKYIGIWIDSMSSTPTISEGTYDPATKSLIYFAEGKGPDGKPAKVKSISIWRNKDHRTFQMFMIGADGKEQPMMTIEYTRKKA